MTKIKKDFQNTIKAIRGEGSNYPKAMMTYVQMEKGEATVNCGGQWSTEERSKARAEMVMADSRFQDFLTRSKAKAYIEFNNADKAFQIRIKFENN